MSAFPSLSVQLIVSVLLCPVWFCSGYRGLEFTSCRPLPLKPLHYTPPPLLFLSVSSFFSFLSWLVEAQQLVHIHCRRLGAMWHCIDLLLKTCPPDAHRTSYIISHHPCKLTPGSKKQSVNQLLKYVYCLSDNFLAFTQTLLKLTSKDSFGFSLNQN